MTVAARLRTAALALILPLAACMQTDQGALSEGGPTTAPETAGPDGAQTTTAAARARADDPATQPARYRRQGLARLRAGELQKASATFNKALKLAPEASDLHLLNGLTYHLMDQRGSATKAEVAEQGYRQALDFNPDNWLAAYYLGHLKLEQRRFAEAQRWFAEALLYRPEDTGILYNMVVASYYAGDPVTAAGVLDRLKTLEPDSRRVLRADAMVRAALGRKAAADDSLEDLADTAPEATVKRVSRRVGQWQDFREWSEEAGGPADAVRDAAAGAGGTAAGARTGGAAGAATAGPDDADGAGDGPPDNDMVIVDVVIIRTEEDVRTSRGVNLLKNLQIQFGGPDMGSRDNTTFPAYQDHRDKRAGPSRTILQTVTVPSLTYSLNIANTTANRFEILARPTLVARSGQKSHFFSGTQINAAATAGGDGESVRVQKEVGVDLTIKPKLRDDGRVQLDAKAERTFLNTPSESIDFTYRLETSKTAVQADVLMGYNNTLVLSGLSEKETNNSRDGVPFLQEIPGIQYLFSERSTRNFQKSVLILLTPRQPAYVYKEGETATRKNRRDPGGGGNDPLAQLKARYADWFRPYPNWASIFHHMQSNQLYREFRTGDVTLERWSDMSKVENRLDQALEFLHW